MSTIRLKNIKIYAFHGCLIEEGQIGSVYLVNLSVRANLDKASNSDELADTVDYVLLQKIVVEQMAVIFQKFLEYIPFLLEGYLEKYLEPITTLQSL